MARYTELSEFSRAFAREYKAYMVASDVKGYQIAEKLDRSIGYLSERINGKRPLDAEDVDALAMLSGWSGKSLMLELARRARSEEREDGESSPGATIHRPDFTRELVDDERAVASPITEEDPDSDYDGA